HLLPHPSNTPLSLPYSAHPPPLHSFPTRRSSDLCDPVHRRRSAVPGVVPAQASDQGHPDRARHPDAAASLPRLARRDAAASGCRSEEHTSELQSQSNLVCRLLLEKKKKKKNQL